MAPACNGRDPQAAGGWGSVGLPGRLAEMVNRFSVLQLFIVLGVCPVFKGRGILSWERCGVRAFAWCLDGARGGSPTKSSPASKERWRTRPAEKVAKKGG